MVGVIKPGFDTKMQLTEIQSYPDLERYLREFVNPLDDPPPYDFVAAVHLLGAILDNLRTYALEAELEAIGECFLPEQIAFLQRLAGCATPASMDSDRLK